MKLTPEQIVKKVKALKGDRGVLNTHWQELADYIMPRKNNITRLGTPGEKKGITLYDNTAMNSCEILAGALHGLLTNPSTIFFELSTGDDDLDDQDEVATYLQDLGIRIHRVLNNSNFQTEVHELYLDLCLFGTAAMSIEADDDSVVTFSTKHLAEVFLEENNKGSVGSVFRVFKWRADQIVQEFCKGIEEKDEAALEEKVGKKVAKAFKKGDKDKFEVIHAVYLESLTKATNPKLPYMSQYILECEKKELSMGGFSTFPWLTPRWTKISGEIYGRSPAMNALPEAKTVNEMVKTVIKGAQKTVDPPVQMPDDGFIGNYRTAPASVHYYRAGTTDRIEPIFNDVRIDFGFEAVRDRQQQIKEAFFTDKINIPQSSRMTTVEVNQRIEEQFRFLGPMVGRQHFEFLRPLIDRVVELMVAADKDGDLIGQAPEALQDRKLDVKYSSPIARSQRVDQAQSLQRALEASLPMIQINQESIDNLDADQYIRQIWKAMGATRKGLATHKEVDEIREARKQAQQAALQQQQQQQEAENVSKTAPLVDKI